MKPILGLCFSISLMCGTGVVHADPASSQAGPPGTAECAALQKIDFSNISDAPTHVTQTNWVAATQDSTAYCEIAGYVVPRVEFLLRLPSKGWNGKFVELGCGGGCGVLSHITRCNDPVQRGYACIVSDGGHKADSSEPMQWAAGQPHAVVDYLIRSSHVAALAGKRIVQHYYRQHPRKSYFMGCSGGGLQAAWQAQLFPSQFDGIVAGGPALSLSRIWLNWLWANRALAGSKGETPFTADDLETLHQAAMAKCDLDDGVQDGVIGDPRACRFDPASLRCDSTKTGRCLTARHVDAAKKIYGGPVTSQGEQIAAPLAMRGSERNWLSTFGGSELNPNPAYTYMKNWYHYSIFEIDLGRAWKPESFNFDQDYKRLGAMEALEPLRSVDLRQFKAAGGKLLAYTGWNDAIEGVLNTIEYYENVEKFTGGRAATQDFFRLFVVPGMGHCAGGAGASTIDWLGYLDAWVEKGQAPDFVLGAHIKSKDLNMTVESDRQQLERRNAFPLAQKNIEFTRPIYPYPANARYKGNGDPADATNFERVEP